MYIPSSSDLLVTGAPRVEGWRFVVSLSAVHPHTQRGSDRRVQEKLKTNVFNSGGDICIYYYIHAYSK